MTKVKSKLELLDEQLRQLQTGNLNCAFSGTTTGRMKSMSVVHGVNYDDKVCVGTTKMGDPIVVTVKSRI